MNNSVVLKSNKYGLSLVLDPSIEFEELVRDVCEKFARSADFFGQAQMILETSGRDLSTEEAAIIIQAIELNSQIKVTLLNENNELKDVKMKGQIDRFYTDNIFENAKIIRGSISKEDTVISDSSVVVIGDVKSKASITAKGNIIIMGSLDGKAYAGYPDNTGCYIVAGNLNSSAIQIGTVAGEIKLQDKWSFRVRRESSEPVGVTVFNKELLAEPISSGLLKKVKH